MAPHSAVVITESTLTGSTNGFYLRTALRSPFTATDSAITATGNSWAAIIAHEEATDSPFTFVRSSVTASGTTEAIRFLKAVVNSPSTASASAFRAAGTSAVLYSSTVSSNGIAMTNEFAVIASGAGATAIQVVGPVVNTDVVRHTGTLTAAAEWLDLGTPDDSSDVSIDTVAMKKV